VLAAALRSLALRCNLECRAAPQPLGRAHAHALYRVTTDRGHVLLKLAAPAHGPMLEAEAQGLAALRDAHALAVPACIDCAVVADVAYLALEWIEFVAPAPLDHAALGRGLAAQHRITSTAFGWSCDNWLGATPQQNRVSADWCGFWREQRLRPQLAWAGSRGLPGSAVRDGRRLLDGLGALLGVHRPVASLLHGDLWGGNWGVSRTGRVYVFDPAVYYGDRESELAMTELFGGFAPEFYGAYARAWPLDAGAASRRELYALYHLLNHFNLFGRAYEARCCASLRTLADRCQA